jgi:NTE family protein
MVVEARRRRRVGRGRSGYGIAFVLSGGAARGALQVGMLEVLLERGIVPDLIVGTSVGAFNGVWMAARPTAAGARQLAEVWRRVRFESLFAGGAMGVLWHVVQHQHHASLYGGEAIRQFLERTAEEGGFPGHAFEDLLVPTAVVATNLTRGRPEVFEHGALLPAMLASAAIPAMLPPVMIDGEQYVDGGLLDNVGLRVAVERGARRIYVLDTSWGGPAQKPAASLEAVLGRSLQVVSAYHLQSALEFYSRRAEVVVLRTEEDIAPNANDFRATAELIAAGRAAAERVLAAPERESARAIRRRRAALWPAVHLPDWGAWVQSPALRRAFATSALSLPERLQLLARSFATTGSASGAEAEPERAAG